MGITQKGVNNNNYKLRRGKDPKRHIPERFTITITFCNSDDFHSITSLRNAQPDTNQQDQPLDVYGRYQTVCQKRIRIRNSNTDSENIQ